MLVIHCSDFRIRREQDLAIERVYGSGAQYDRYTIPGSCRRLVRESDDTRDQMISDISLLIDKHQPETIVLIQHEDCGAYGGREAFQSPEAENEMLASDLHASASLLRQKFPRVTVHGYIIRMNGDEFARMDRVDTPNASQAPSPQAEFAHRIRA